MPQRTEPVKLGHYPEVTSISISGWASLSVSIYFCRPFVLWQLAAIAKVDFVCIRAIIVSFFVASVVCAFLSWKFIVAAPAIFSAVIAALLGFTFYADRSGMSVPKSRR
jgi:hypothetical protein